MTKDAFDSLEIDLDFSDLEWFVDEDFARRVDEMPSYEQFCTSLDMDAAATHEPHPTMQ